MSSFNREMDKNKQSYKSYLLQQEWHDLAKKKLQIWLNITWLKCFSKQIVFVRVHVRMQKVGHMTNYSEMVIILIFILLFGYIKFSITCNKIIIIISLTSPNSRKR